MRIICAAFGKVFVHCNTCNLNTEGMIDIFYSTKPRARSMHALRIEYIYNIISKEIFFHKLTIFMLPTGGWYFKSLEVLHTYHIYMHIQ